MSAVLTVLGAGSSLPRAGYGCAGYALRPEPGGPVTLLDCGPGSVRSLGTAEIELDAVERVVLSHYHLDHCADLLALAFARRNPFYHGLPPIELIGPRGLTSFLDRAVALAGSSASFGDALVREVDPAGGTLETGGLTLSWAPTGHTDSSVAWRVTTAAGETLAYSGDSGEVDALVELARSVDLFLCECSFPDGEGVPQHMTPSSAARTASRAGVRALLLTHFYPELDPETAREAAARIFRGPLSAARDGARYPLRLGHLAQ